MGIYVLSLISILTYARSFSHGNPVVTTKYGAVEGLSVPIHTGQVIDTFMAVPYARPPVGDLRFMRPEEPLPWNETLLAYEPGNACMQEKLTGVLISHWQWDKFDEDCLNINIYTPQTTSTELLPVLVFIHGGGFMNGANFLYPGYFQAAQGVVVVTVNYRLGVLGFATTEDEVMPGNLGLFDQTQALRFIQDNIEAFGGDPSKVTISGESAGAASVGFHLVSSVSEGLFHQAVLQSGTELAIWAVQPPAEQPSNYLEQVAEKVGCTVVSSIEMVECLRTIDAQRLVEAGHNFTCTEGYACGAFRATVDGTFLTDLPSVLRENGNYTRVPEMIGLCEDEGSSSYLSTNTTEGLSREYVDEQIAEIIATLSPKWPDPSREFDAVQAVRFYYTAWPYFDDPYENRYIYSKIWGDLYYGHSSNLQAKIHSSDTAVFYYVWDYREENFDRLPDYYGAYHTSELSFTFSEVWMWSEENAAAYSHSQFNARNGTEYERTDNDRAVADFMTSLWTNFAKYGNPTPEPVGVEGSTAIVWPEFVSSNRSYAYLADNPDVRLDYRQKEFAFWEHYFSYISYGETFELDNERLGFKWKFSRSLFN